jgi:hypothetical protein
VIVRLALWNLADSMTTVEELRRYLTDEAAGEHAEAEGLRLKLWVGDAGTERWGVIELFESREAAEQEIPTRAEELIGKPADIVEEFDLEGSIEGPSTVDDLSHRGLAFEGD